MDDFIKQLQHLVQNGGHTIEADSQTKEILIRHRETGVRYTLCNVNRPPSDMGFVFNDSTHIVELIAAYLIGIATEVMPGRGTPDLELQKLSQIELLKGAIKDSILGFANNSESPILRDTIVGILTSLAMEFNQLPTVKKEES